MTPTSPYGVNIGGFGNLHNEIDISIVIVVGSTWYLHKLVGHSDVLGVGSQILWGGHHSKLDGTFVTKGLVSPFPDRPYFFHGSNTVICDQNAADHGMTLAITHKLSDFSWLGNID